MLAHKMGSTHAAYRLGMVHWEGEAGVEVNFSEAMKWLKPAADGGDPDALYKVGVAYRYGQGVEKDEKKGQSYVHEASNLGQPEAMATLAEDLLAGEHGEAKNGAEAHRLAKAAAEKGDPDGMNLLGRMYISLAYPEGALVKDIKGSPQEGLRWMEKAAEAGIYRKHASSCFVIGAAYLAMPQDGATGFLVETLGGATNFPTGFGSVKATMSALNVGGATMPRDLHKAERFLIKAAKLGARGAGELLIRKGFQDPAINPNTDPARTKKALDDLVAADDAWAIYTLGVAYARGELGLKSDAKEAERLVRLAADRGNLDARRIIAAMDAPKPDPITLITPQIVDSAGFPRVLGYAKNISNGTLDANVEFDLIDTNGVILEHYSKTLFSIPPGGTEQIEIAIAPRHRNARVQVRGVKWR
jgi:TPR repeat protein